MVEKRDKLLKEELEVYGQKEQGNVCSLCNGNLKYCDNFDTYFCPPCNCWTEPKYHDPHCPYCRNRPETPMPR
ncbi:hypothetical protein ACIQXI_07375 [Lysinibacillus sp. NPDC097195]|uniref:hypothetical protein n=1 Tax=Lysinibacillus sp. NPDC097195 TaxID=3364141 RepID=UPI0038161775